MTNHKSGIIRPAAKKIIIWLFGWTVLFCFVLSGLVWFGLETVSCCVTQVGRTCSSAGITGTVPLPIPLGHITHLLKISLLLDSNVKVFCKYVIQTVWLSFEIALSWCPATPLKLHRFTKQNCFYLINLNLSHPLFKHPTVPALCLAIYASAQAAASLTPGSKSSKHITRESRVPQSTVACASYRKCLPTARSMKTAAFL